MIKKLDEQRKYERDSSTTANLQAILIVLYLVVGGLMSFVSLWGIGDSLPENRAAAVSEYYWFNLAMWLPVLVCVALSIWLHAKKKLRFSLLVMLIAPVLAVLVIIIFALLVN